MPSWRTRSRPVPRASARTSGTKETLRFPTASCEAREVAQRHPQPWRPLVSLRVAAHELELAVVDPPEHAVVRAERRPRLTADGRGHLVGRVGVEARRDLQDAVERRPGLALAVVEAGALERLLRKHCDSRRDGGELVVDGVRADRTGTRRRRTGFPATRRGTATIDWTCCGRIAALSGNSRSSAARSFARTSRPRGSPPSGPSGCPERCAGPGTWRLAARPMGSTTRTSSLSSSASAAPSAPKSTAACSARACETSSEEAAPGGRRSASAVRRRAPESSRPRARPRSRASARAEERPRTRRSASPRRD